MKRIIAGILVLVFIFFCGCVQPTTTVGIITPTPATVVPTFLTPIATPGPVPTVSVEGFILK